MNLSRILKLKILGGGGLPSLYASDGFSAYPTTDGLGNPVSGYRSGSGNNKTWNVSGYGTWGAAGGVMTCSVLAGGVGVNGLSAGSPNVRVTVQIPSYTAGWAGCVLRYYNSYNFVYAYWDGTYIRMTKMVDGSSTGLIASVQTFANGAIVTLECDLTTFRVKLNGVQVGADQTIVTPHMMGYSYHGVITSNVNNQFDNFNCYPFGTTRVYNILPFGDSKTTGTGDTLYRGGYPSQLCTAALQFCEYPLRIATGGATVASRAGTIAADLAAAIGTPEYILCNLGANDVASLPAEATWKANYQTIINAARAKWGSVKIYIMLPWRRNYATECNSLATWIADLVTSNPGVVYAGPDERVFLEGGDDGATYTGDGIHPNAAGYTLTGTQWRTVLGF